MRLSIGRKITIMVASISIIFVVALFVIKSTTNRVADLFSHFYENDFVVSMQFEEIKEQQVDVILNIRGLQIAYLLNLNDQVDGYLATLNRAYTSTPELIKQLQSDYEGDKKTLQKFVKSIEDYHVKAKAFVNAMNDSPNNKAPFSIFSAFVKAYDNLNNELTILEKQIDESAQLTQAKMDKSINQAETVFYVAVIIAIIAASVLSLYISGGIRSGIKRVRDAANELANGNLHHDVHVKGNDEIADLALSINETLKHLREIIGGIANSTTVVTENSATVLDFNQQVNQLTLDVTDNTNQVVTAIEEMSATSKNIAENTNNTASASSDMEGLAKKGLAASQNTIESIGEMANELLGTAEVITKLQQEIGNIEKILEVIQGISEQTNLLALNAAIEAARAGEQGRGFAVVADEVRGLAQRSHSSVSEIETLLGQLNTAGDEAVRRMESSNQNAEVSKQKVSDNNLLISEILAQIETVNSQAQQIASAAEEQSAVAEDISKNMHNVQTLTNRSAEIANKTNRHSEEMNTVSKQVLEQTRFFKL